MPVSWETPEDHGTLTIHNAYVNGDNVGCIRESCFGKTLIVRNPVTDAEISRQSYLHSQTTLDMLKAAMELATEDFA
jgi:hypothetical protein